MLLADALIAATALACGETLSTKNGRHFRMITALTVVRPSSTVHPGPYVGLPTPSRALSCGPRKHAHATGAWRTWPRVLLPSMAHARPYLAPLWTELSGDGLGAGDTCPQRQV
jgi:hypothetical protein